MSEHTQRYKAAKKRDWTFEDVGEIVASHDLFANPEGDAIMASGMAATLREIESREDNYWFERDWHVNDLLSGFVVCHADYDPTPEETGGPQNDDPELYMGRFDTLSDALDALYERFCQTCQRCGQRTELFDAEEYNGRLYYGLGAAPANRSDPADGVNVVEVCADCLNTEVAA